MEVYKHLKTLDLACGDGGFNEILACSNRLERGSWLDLYGNEDTFGIDYNGVEIKRAGQQICNGTRFIVADACALPFEHGYFNHVHLFGGLHHMKKWKWAVSEIDRVTTPDATLDITDTVDNWPLFKVTRRIAGKWDGSPITGYFTSQQLLLEFGQYFHVKRISYHHRPFICDTLRMFDKEPQISLKLLAKLDTVLKKIGIDEFTACHMVMWCDGKNKGKE